MSKNSGNVLSEFVDKISFANYLPLLTRATAENDEPTAGYMLKDIENITFRAPTQSSCQHLAEYLNRRLEKPSPVVKFKVLKIMSYLIQNGHLDFRNYLRRNDGAIKMATMYSGPPDPLVGMALYESVRRTSQALLDTLFRSDLMHRDETQPEEKTSLHLGGLGSTGGSKGKYEGFGSSPLDKEETVKDKMLDMLERLVNPTDETAEKIKSAMSSSPGDYEAVSVEVHQDATPQKETPRMAPKIKAHVPGRAGGGWESDDDAGEIPKSMSTSSGSTVSGDSLEEGEWPFKLNYESFNLSQFKEIYSETEGFQRMDPEPVQVNLVRKMVTEFCSIQEWPVSLSQLKDVCKETSDVNFRDALKAINRQLLEQASDISLLRALLMLEWYMRADVTTPHVISGIVSTSLDMASKSESSSEAVRLKAHKIQLSLDKLEKITL